MYPVLLHCRRLVARTLPFQGGEAGSIPVDSTKVYWHIAQLVERSAVNRNVPGSSPGLPANFICV